MKLKSLSFIAGAIALTLTTTSLAVKAQAFSHSPLLVAQAEGQGRWQGKKGPWAELGLTDAQKSQIEQIQRNTRTQIENVFTPEQKAKIKAAMEARRAERQANPGQRVGRRGGKDFADLNLTEAQKTQIRQIRESSKQQIEAVLTPEQKTKLQQLRQNGKERRQQRRQPNT
ncbi:P pilus assembly/Cpx signaling pathway, periplasmic inhibitor/zinc-resistance associated protein [Nostoc spongiaeforme FACHB-130]|uniref:P pilus assembly/Cpx signaling pathway, periplasmic inhibitor/zinc-resistance associated protein n=1 Tax=Nostoc spongiaeforme FACHB-130 TaxID=1357510 RepID=A0ABR8FY49_9NOSO|nr:P pilus assembly/Cpx signaling pathway, periplasmic inhibitor/zinc-resistance associated protein [Nostoc spongiaeforme]MBD2596362.1 P pilus assembly/Cpx signaling pathway, periplasmic inhibitor/zinc-resistance associated protein [Nostoc spongiaeforme FACHB-130]